MYMYMYIYTSFVLPADVLVMRCRLTRSPPVTDQLAALLDVQRFLTILYMSFLS